MDEKKLIQSGKYLLILAASYLILVVFSLSASLSLEPLQLMTLLSAALICLFSFQNRKTQEVFASVFYLISFFLTFLLKKAKILPITEDPKGFLLIWVLMYLLGVGIEYILGKCFT